MSLQVSFRVVGLYCYFENLQVPNVTSDSTVKEVMDSIKTMPEVSKFNFNYESVSMSGKEIVDTMQYDYMTGQSKQPYNSSVPTPGFRDLENSLGSTSIVWQYYRSVTGEINGSVCEIKLLSKGQPSFATTPLNFNDSFFGSLPSGFNIHTYNLTWRPVQIQMSPEKQAQFIQAKAKRLAAKYGG